MMTKNSRSIDGAKRHRWKHPLFVGSMAFAALFTVLHCAALPLVITYDGHEYINYADVLFSARFPSEWKPPIRTPGYPVALRVSFELLGRHPISVLAVNAILGLGTALLIGAMFMRRFGPTAASSAVIAVALFPLSVAYQHAALTETGTAFFIVLVTVLATARATTVGGAWGVALALGLALACGYYYRQSVQFVVLPAAALFALRALMSFASDSGPIRHPWRAAITVLAQALCVVAVPVGAAKLWEPYAPAAPIRAYMVKQGIIRQMLLPPRHPALGEAAEPYQSAIDEAYAEGPPVGGLRAHRIGELAPVVYPILEPPVATLLRLAFEYPDRYLAGIARTVFLYCGYPPLQDTNKSVEYEVFGPGLAKGYSPIADGLPNLTENTRRDFMQRTGGGLLSSVLWRLAPWFDHGLVPLGFVALVIAGIMGAIRRDLVLIGLCVIPLCYVLAHVLILASENRYAFPSQPLAVAALCVLACKGFRRVLLELVGRWKRRNALGA